MKHSYNLAFIAAALTIALFSCEKNDELAAENYDEYADEISATLSTDFETIAQDVNLLASGKTNGRNTSKDCSVLYDTAISKAYSGEVISYLLDLQYGYEFVCSQLGIPLSMSWNYSSMGVWNGARFNIDGESTGDLEVTQLVTGTEFIVNGSISRTQSLTQKNENQKTLNSQSAIKLIDLKIDKNTLAITTGSAEFTATGVSSSGTTYSYSCTVVYSGDGTALFTFMNGETFTLDLSTMEFE